MGEGWPCWNQPHENELKEHAPSDIQLPMSSAPEGRPTNGFKPMLFQKERTENFKSQAQRAVDGVKRDIHFLSAWAKAPLRTGAVKPSSKALAKTMAQEIPKGEGPVIELGPGTGNVTDAILDQGVAESDLILLEFNPEFAELLEDRFPAATVIRGDAYAPHKAVEPLLDIRPRATVSGLPLLTKPPHIRQRLLHAYLDIMQPGAPFIQFTYCWVSPVPQNGTFNARGTQLVPGNLPPARVWVYSKA